MQEKELGQMMWDDFWCGKMSPEHSLQEKTKTESKEKISESSSKKSAKSQTQQYIYLNLKTGNGKNSDVSWETRSLFRMGAATLQNSPSRSGETGYTLSQILTDAPPKYALSPRACQGILNRAERRGKTLPEMLEMALRNTISNANEEEKA